MLQASRLTVKDGTTNITIAGQSGGRKVICSPRALHTYKELVQLATVNNNYWALLIVKAIDGLATGRLQKDNIYIEKKMSMAYGKGAFHIVLPGITASLEDASDGTYILQRIKADTNYMKLQEESQAPGLWRVTKDAGIDPEFQPDGMIQKKDYRPVVISDMATDDIQTVAQAIRDDLVGTNGTIEAMVKNDGFDLHHTPGDSGIVGLKKAEDALATSKDKKIVQSATLLANSMYKARSIDGVLWYSDWGGSAVLTRALQILSSEKGIQLDNHSIFMNRPTSPAKEAINLAEKIGIKKLDKGKSTGLTPKEIRGHIIHTDVTVKGIAKTTGSGLAAAGAAFGLAGATLSTAGVVGVAGGLIYIGSAVKAGEKNFSSKKYK